MSEKSYLELLAKLYEVNRFSGSRLGLQNIQQLNALLGSREKAFASVHVAGTNGKGSVTTKIARALQYAGFRVGCYTSPHVSCFRERIQVNGVFISEDEVERLLDPILNVANRYAIPATFFELTTALAFVYFEQSQVDVAVLETGLGGRLDATNCVTPLVSVITSIGLEHTEILGPTREEIAREKGGIIKALIPVVIGPHADLPMIHALASQAGSALVVVPSQQGDFDAENQAIARAALHRLQEHLTIPPHALEQGVRSVPPARFEVVPHSILKQKSNEIILDVAHNPDALARLVKALVTRYPSRTFRFLCGFSKDKDIVGCLEQLRPIAQGITFICANHVRGLPVDECARCALQAGIERGKIKTAVTIQEGLEMSCQIAAQNKDILVICGSFFIMGDVRRLLGYLDPVDPFPLNECLRGR